MILTVKWTFRFILSSIRQRLDPGYVIIVYLAPLDADVFFGRSHESCANTVGHVLIPPSRRLLEAIVPSQSFLLLAEGGQWQRSPVYRNYAKGRATIAKLFPESSPPGDAAVGIGDLDCIYNARSPHLRCAVNPTGPCVGCGDRLARRSPDRGKS